MSSILYNKNPININNIPNLIDTSNLFSNKGFDIGNSIQIIAVLVALITFLLTRNYNIKIASRRATIDLIQSENSKEFTIRRDSFVESRDNLNVEKITGKFFREKASDLDKQSRKNLLFMLNYYEFVCIGIKNKAYDENIYRNWLRSTLVSDWIILKVFVREFRNEDIKNRKDSFKNYENLVLHWANPEEKKKL